MSRVKKYNSTTSKWEYADGPAGNNFVKSSTTGNLTVSDTQPSSPLESDVWIEPGGKIGASDIADGAVTASKVAWSTLGTKVLKNTSSYTVNSTTMSDKITGTLDAGTYIAIAQAIFGSGNSAASGECNIRVRYGSSYTPGTTCMMPSTSATYNSATPIEQAVIVIPSDGTAVALQASVNWPARGTYSVAAHASSLTFIRIA